jgi:DNA adenine methylase
MRYSGSKARFIKELTPILTEHLDGSNTFYDCFMGGANVISNIDYDKKVGIELNRYILSLWFKILHEGTADFLPDTLTREEYEDIRENYINRTDKYPDWLIGYVGSCCSFGGAWFNGYAAYNPKKNEDHIKEAKRGIMKQVENFKHIDGTHVLCGSYLDFEYPAGSVLYCDPPYADTKKYESDFNHNLFWEWVRMVSQNGCYVYVSEYRAPSDFKCIWQKEKKDGMGSSATGVSKTKVEKLFVYNG